MNFDIIKKALILALEEAGISEYEIYYSNSAQMTVETLNKEVSAFSSGERGGLCLRLIKDGRMGYASTELMKEQEMRELVERALGNARVTEKEDAVGFFAGSESYREVNFQSNQADASRLRSLATGLAEKIYEYDERVTDGTCTTALTHTSSVRLLNSHGLDLSGGYTVSVALGEAVVEANGEKQADYSIKVCTAESEGLLIDIAKEAVDGALSKIGAGSVESGKYDLVIGARPMAALLSTFSSVFSAKAALEGMSRLLGKEGERIASDFITVTDDPAREGCPIATAFDAEGVATERREIIKHGVLTTLLHNRESAKRMGVKTTANASKASYSSQVGIRPYSMCIEPGDKQLCELLAMAEGGIYISEFKGLHAGANAITGDFSLECEGYMIEGAKRGTAVSSFTVSGNFFSLLEGVSAVGSDLDIGAPMSKTSFGSPSLLVKGMSVAGK